MFGKCVNSVIDHGGCQRVIPQSMVGASPLPRTWLLQEE